MPTIDRRSFLKLGALASAAAVASKGVLKAAELKEGGQDVSPASGAERRGIPSACWSCVTRDAMIGYVEGGRLVKLEGHPESIRGLGKICAKGQAGINQLYDPDRVLYPMKRVGKRGEGRWKRISWDEALEEIAARLKKLRDEGHAEKFMFHYGRMKASYSKLIKSVFLATYGTKTIGNHTAICESAKWTAQELTWGRHYDNWDFDRTNLVFNFGSNCLEAHTNHIPVAQRLVRAMAERGVRLVTFDLRLSNTAARSSEWVPVRPGTDGAVILAMCYVIMNEGLYEPDFFTFIKATEHHEATLEEKVAALRSHLVGFTPRMAEEVSGVSAKKIAALAREFATTKPAVLISYRGAVANYNGIDTERACQMLAAITGNIDNPGGRCRGVAAHWKYPKGPKDKPKAKKLDILDGFEGQAAYPTHHMSHQVFKVIKEGSRGRPDVYMWFCYSPVYANGEVQENIEVLKDENLLPFTVCVNAYYDEAAALADIILPSPSYLEWWGWEDHVSPTQIPEYFIRQPLVKPLGEARDFGDVVCDLSERMGMPLGFKSHEEFVKLSCEMTPGVKQAGGFEAMKKHGVWHDPEARPAYYTYRQQVDPVALTHEGVIYDEESGVYWNWRKSKAHSEEEARQEGYTRTKSAYKGYVGQRIGDKIYKGFSPDRVNKSGYFELYSVLLKEKGLSPLPVYRPIPELQELKPGEFQLTTYKVNVHIHSRSANCKWLSEIYHHNPAWINPKSAAELGIKTGDRIRIESAVGRIETEASLTEAIVPGVVAVSHHCGHWEYGRYASGKTAPAPAGGDDRDTRLKWWKKNGVHPNWVIANSPDPVGGQQRWNDTRVRVTRL